MTINHKEYKEKFEKCKFQNRGFCLANDTWIEGPLAMMAHCGNCRANTKEPNLF